MRYLLILGFIGVLFSCDSPSSEKEKMVLGCWYVNLLNDTHPTKNAIAYRFHKSGEVSQIISNEIEYPEGAWALLGDTLYWNGELYLFTELTNKKMELKPVDSTSYPISFVKNPYGMLEGLDE